MHEGLGLWRLAPWAWLVTIGLAFTANLAALAGYGLAHVQMQTVLMLSMFFGSIALAGTVQWVRRALDTGRLTRAWTVTTIILIVAVVVLHYSVPLASNSSG